MTPQQWDDIQHSSANQFVWTKYQRILRAESTQDSALYLFVSILTQNPRFQNAWCQSATNRPGRNT